MNPLQFELRPRRMGTLTIDAGEWVIRTALGQTVRWQAQGLGSKPVDRGLP